ncbi:sulfurtransferase [Tenggerimyces flavus]|uniref:Sulfurtransferase n=1 Tax=Tenggerimyces flavus TaxID=1708749 RepID=A0ABV7YP16_9ACTN|nr:sulfurtransferase [Tenggerimyces flavus]MBM7787684.1 thiosulfate/3-mercaptopyruvate sulfurtransferase [Tenggerimyces flavus]
MSLISVSELAAALAGSHRPVVLDIRWSLGGPPGRPLYDAGHVPGAVYVDLEDVFSGPHGSGGRHPMPAADQVSSALRAAGVRNDSPVVVYGPPDGFAAARAWWCLRYFGQTAVSVLDGGYPAWVAAGQPVSTSSPLVEAGDFVATPGSMPLLSAESAAALARTGILADARAGERYRGEVEPIDPVGGHIPGAVSVPTKDNLDASGRFLPAEALRARFDALGLAKGEVGVYCGSGVSAAQEVLALELAGIPAALYVGSWSDWVSDASRPVSTGADPG